MKKVQPYRSFDGANRALDNGGRLWNVFTEAADRVITKAEIAAAGGGGGWASALLFFELSTSRLKEGERAELAHRLTPKLRRRWRQKGPELVSPGRLDSLDDVKRPYLIEGLVHRVEKEDSSAGFIPVTTMIANVPMTVMTPVTQMFAVFELCGDRGGLARILAHRRSTLADGARIRFGGRLRRGREGKEKRAKRRNFFEADFYTELE